jgi:two-component system NtrC family sensor kinase
VQSSATLPFVTSEGPSSGTARGGSVPPLTPGGAPPRAGLRLQLVLALGALTILAFVPLYLAVASLTRHTLRSTREDVARALSRAVAGRLADDAAAGHDPAALRDVARVSLDGASSGEGVVAIRVLSPSGPVEVGSGPTLDTLRAMKPAAPGERVLHADVPGVGPILAVEVSRSPTLVQVALRVGDQASRAAPLLNLVAFYTAAFAVVLVIFAYLLLGRLIVRPIAALVATTRRIGERSSARIGPVSGAAEVVELGTVIARTTGQLVEREQTLAAKVKQLEAAKVDLLAARDAIVRSERLASVGRLAAGLAHEVGNPIAALLGLEDVVLQGPLDEETRDLIERMKRETERVHRVMRDLLDFARAEQEPRLSEVEASASVREVAEEVAALVKPQRTMRDVTVDLEIDAQLKPVRIAGSRLQQVLLNLVLNAADAIADHARTQGIEPRGEPLGRIVVRARPGDGPTVRVEVEDDGPGVPDAIRDRLFEPFVTTKEVGKGTGLGLAVCRGLVEGAGGRIALDHDHVGGRFVIDLPTIDAPPRPRSIAPSALA